MADSKTFRTLALSFPGTTEAPHFDRAAFKANKKIFATLQEAANIGMVQLSIVDQSVYCAIDNEMIYPVPGGWGLKGSTYIALKKIKKTLLKEVMKVAYDKVMSKVPKK